MLPPQTATARAKTEICTFSVQRFAETEILVPVVTGAEASRPKCSVWYLAVLHKGLFYLHILSACYGVCC